MGFGMDEELEEDFDRDSTAEEKHAMRTLDYDHDEFFALGHAQQRQQIRLAKRMSKTK